MHVGWLKLVGEVVRFKGGGAGFWGCAVREWVSGNDNGIEEVVKESVDGLGCGEKDISGGL
ncbi:TMV resistance protein N-like isoform X1 [Sesbania bispinosa]|nr:TMV resistance protein N-like isoform X1 [Sesbania bispinosa]